MNIEAINPQAFRITDAAEVGDPIRVYAEEWQRTDHDGRLMNGALLTVVVFGEAWSAAWGNMGSQNLWEFLATTHDQYMADKLFNGSPREIDYDTISEVIGETVDVTTLLMSESKIRSAYGDDWHHNLPECETSQYVYLRSIVRSLILAAQQKLESTDRAKANND